jgi:uncharacterized membrane-anchored protein YitT (DUF2179 family)
VVVLMGTLMAVNYQIFILPNAFAPAGLNGIATMIQYKFHFSIGYMSLLINLPLCIVAFLILNREYAVKTIFFSLAFSVMMLVYNYRLIDLQPYIYVTENGTSTILGPVTASVINGFIYGTVFRMNGSTGGTDVVAAMIHRRDPRANTLWLIFSINCLVAVSSYFVYGYRIEPVILCILYCFFTSFIGDRIIKGGKQGIRFEIITNHPNEISQEIIQKLRHSVTRMEAIGMFSGSPRTVLICVINRHQIVEMERILSGYPDVFAYMSTVRETIGNFKYISAFHRGA